MFICKNVLSADDIKYVKSNLANLKFFKSNAKLGASHKQNKELVVEELSNFVMEKILQHETVMKYGFIRDMTLPRFNLYEIGDKYNKHVDFFQQEHLRTDWSMTLFLNNPFEYKGGELVIEVDDVNTQQIKLPQGDMILYPSGLIHKVNPVTSGDRLAAIAWAESLIPSVEKRKILGKLVDTMTEVKDTELTTNLSYVYNNLIREWS